MPSECEDLVKLLENIEQKTRINYAKILSAASWEKVRDTMNAINDRINFGLGITAIPEEFRSHATSHLESQVHREVSDIITRVQGNIDYDPSMLFPRVATAEFMSFLPLSAQRCYLCNQAFKDFQKILWKYCQN
jgi:hypothetical protein